MRKTAYLILVIVIFVAAGCSRKVTESIQTSKTSVATHDSVSYTETTEPVEVNIPSDSVEINIPIILDSLNKNQTFEFYSEGERIKLTGEIVNNRIKIKAISKDLKLVIPAKIKKLYQQTNNNTIDKTNSSIIIKKTPWYATIFMKILFLSVIGGGVIVVLIKLGIIKFK